MIYPTPIEVRAVVSTLEKKELLILLHDLKATEPVLSVEQQLHLYVHEWLKHWRCFKDTQVERLLTRVTPLLNDLALWLRLHFVRDQWRGNVPTCTITVVERRFATWSGAPVWHDLDFNDVTFQELPWPGVTMMTCNLYALFLLKQRWLRHLKEGSAHGHTDPQIGRPKADDAQATSAANDGSGAEQ